MNPSGQESVTDSRLAVGQPENNSRATVTLFFVRGSTYMRALMNGSKRAEPRAAESVESSRGAPPADPFLEPSRSRSCASSTAELLRMDSDAEIRRRIVCSRTTLRLFAFHTCRAHCLKSLILSVIAACEVSASAVRRLLPPHV